jgi:hypothetical protein
MIQGLSRPAALDVTDFLMVGQELECRINFRLGFDLHFLFCREKTTFTLTKREKPLGFTPFQAIFWIKKIRLLPLDVSETFRLKFVMTFYNG